MDKLDDKLSKVDERWMGGRGRLMKDTAKLTHFRKTQTGANTHGDPRSHRYQPEVMPLNCVPVINDRKNTDLVLFSTCEGMVDVSIELESVIDLEEVINMRLK